MSDLKEIWLTFDDGPRPRNTDQILRILEIFKIKATFFVIGKNAGAFKSLVQCAFDAGHRIGNHSYTHADFAMLTEYQMRDEIERADEVIAEYTGAQKIFRPPYGRNNAKIRNVASQLGYRTVFWNVDTLDWKRDYQPIKWVEHGLAQIRERDKCKILAHDSQNTTAENFETVNHIHQLGKVRFEPPSTL